MFGMHPKIPSFKKAGNLLRFMPLIRLMSPSVEEDKGEFIVFELNTRVRQPTDSIRFKK
jgi:hypothetical protein